MKKGTFTDREIVPRPENGGDTEDCYVDRMWIKCGGVCIVPVELEEKVVQPGCVTSSAEIIPAPGIGTVDLFII